MKGGHGLFSELILNSSPTIYSPEDSLQLHSSGEQITSSCSITHSPGPPTTDGPTYNPKGGVIGLLVATSLKLE